VNLDRFGLVRDADRGLLKTQQLGGPSSKQPSASRRPEGAGIEALGGLFEAAVAAKKKTGSKPKAKVKPAKPSKPAAKKPTKAKSTAKKDKLPSREEQRAKLIEQFGLVDFDEDITQMDLDTIRRHFGYISGTINKGLFVNNIIWQLYRMAQAGKAPAFIKNGANIRSLWYYVKKVVREHPRIFNVSGDDDLDGLFSKQLAEMVRGGLLSYKDLNLNDDREAARRIAPLYGNPHIILMGEKFSFLPKLIEVGLRYGITIQCSKGMPSLIMADTMITQMAEAGYDMTQEFIILAFNDFDPTGWNIGNTFARHLKELGVKNIRRFHQYPSPRDCLDVVCPHDLPSDFLERARNSLSADRRREEQTRKWANATGGVYQRGGTEHAVSAEELLEFFDEMLAEKIAPFLAQKPEVFNRLINLEYLSDVMGKYLLERVLAVQPPVEP
jgi:hypothetical protein